jgi:hypothetical protein
MMYAEEGTDDEQLVHRHGLVIELAGRFGMWDQCQPACLQVCEVSEGHYNCTSHDVTEKMSDEEDERLVGEQEGGQWLEADVVERWKRAR